MATRSFTYATCIQIRFMVRSLAERKKLDITGELQNGWKLFTCSALTICISQWDIWWCVVKYILSISFLARCHVNTGNNLLRELTAGDVPRERRACVCHRLVSQVR